MSEKISARSAPEAQETLGALLRLPYQVLQDRIYHALSEGGFPEIRPAHSAVFRHILPEGSRIIDLANRAQITKQSMGYLVDYLAEHGYVETQPDPDDGRAKRVCLTEKGQRFLDAALQLSHEVEEEVAARMESGEMTELRRLLHSLYAAIVPAR